jgi:hypothetical protein
MFEKTNALEPEQTLQQARTSTVQMKLARAAALTVFPTMDYVLDHHWKHFQAQPMQPVLLKRECAGNSDHEAARTCLCHQKSPAILDHVIPKKDKCSADIKTGHLLGHLQLLQASIPLLALEIQLAA